VKICTLLQMLLYTGKHSFNHFVDYTDIFLFLLLLLWLPQAFVEIQVFEMFIMLIMQTLS